MCASLQSIRTMLVCCIPMLWPYRLYLTLRRAAPLDVKFLCFNCSRLGERVCGTFAVVLLVFLLLVLTCGLAGFLWGSLLLAVCRKYNINEALTSPSCFICKACCCLGAMNFRVGLHVDRAQGFHPPDPAVFLAVERVVELSERADALEARRLAREVVITGGVCTPSTDPSSYEDSAIIAGLAEPEEIADFHPYRTADASDCPDRRGQSRAAAPPGSKDGAGAADEPQP